MAATEAATSGDLVIKPCGRAFFVYYVAMALVLVGPRLNPAVGLPTWLGTLLGLIVWPRCSTRNTARSTG